MDSINLTNHASSDSIQRAWNGIMEAKPGIRIREAAEQLDLSEMQLLATLAGEEAIRLNQDWTTLLNGLPSLGRVMSLTRNDACILEHKGTFEKINIFGSGDHRMATVIGPIETRVFLKNWYVAFAVRQKKNDRLLTSLQIFDHEGQAITKIYLQDHSDYDAYTRLVETLQSDNQEKTQEANVYPPQQYNENIEIPAFLQSWSELKDTHDFFPLLRKYKVHRFTALKIAEGRFTSSLPVNIIQPLLESASKRKLPIMIFAGNRGNLQIHQDKVRTIRLLERGHTGMETWLNVLDPDFNMHLRTDLIQDAWVVTKPTTDGDVTSIECYDKNRELVVQFFGLRKPGSPQLQEWKDLVNEIQAKSLS